MEFYEKLQQMRKQKNLTQEELAELLFVSRTAVSKWESGRGYPSIDSLKAISRVFAVSIDELLSSEEIISIAEEEKKETAISMRQVIYGLLDVLMAAFFFLPLFGQPTEDMIQSVSLLALEQTETYIFIMYVVILGATAAYGIVELVLQNLQNRLWVKYNALGSLALTIVGTTLFIMSQEPYVAFFLLWILVIKGYVYVNRR